MQKLIPYAHALALQERGVALARGQSLVEVLVAQVAQDRQRMLDALTFLGLPADKPVTLKLEDGADTDGMVAVEWAGPPEENQDAAT